MDTTGYRCFGVSLWTCVSGNSYSECSSGRIGRVAVDLVAVAAIAAVITVAKWKDTTSSAGSTGSSNGVAVDL